METQQKAAKDHGAGVQPRHCGGVHKHGLQASTQCVHYHILPDVVVAAQTFELPQGLEISEFEEKCEKPPLCRACCGKRTQKKFGETS